jgi:hypothetical protein
MTVIQAMIQGPKAGDQSYFDMYANDELRRRVQGYITGEYGEVKQPFRSDFEIQSDTLRTEDFSSHMTTGPQFYLLVTAQHVSVSGGDISTYGFKAVSNVYLPDYDPPSFDGNGPIVAAIEGNLAYKPSIANDNSITYVPVIYDTWSSSPASYSYSGTVTLVFNKDLYYMDDAGNRYAVVMTRKDCSECKTALANSTDSLISAEDIIDGASFSVPKEHKYHTTQAGKSFTFNFDRISSGYTLVLFQSGQIGNSTDGYTAKKLRLTFNPTLQYKDYSNEDPTNTQARPGFTYSWN